MAYKVNYPIIGQTEQSSAPQLYANQGLIRGQAYIQTTDNTQTTLFSVPVSTSPSAAIRINFTLQCGTDDGTKVAAHTGVFTSCAYHDGSSTTTLVTPTITLTTAGGSFGVTAIYTLSGNDMQIRVTGLAATTINWVMTYEYFSVNI